MANRSYLFRFRADYTCFEAVNKGVKLLEAAFEDYDKFKTSDEDKAIYHQEVRSILESLEPAILFELVVNIKERNLAKRCFVYLWNGDFENKKEPLIKLFIFLGFSDYEINLENFGNQFPDLISGEDDTNLSIAKSFLDIPKAYFRNDSMWKKSKQAYPSEQSHLV